MAMCMSSDPLIQKIRVKLQPPLIGEELKSPPFDCTKKRKNKKKTSFDRFSFRNELKKFLPSLLSKKRNLPKAGGFFPSLLPRLPEKEAKRKESSPFL